MKKQIAKPLDSDTLILCDFDGTISEADIGNKIHRSVFPEDFDRLQKSYRAGELSLRELQFKMWTNFPMGKVEFENRAMQFSGLRAGFREFLNFCIEKKHRFTIVSCGIREYIEASLRATLSEEEIAAIENIHCLEARFNHQSLEELLVPESDGSDVTLHKGRIADQYRARRNGLKILGIGNGTSDRSMIGHVDRIAATDALARYSQSHGVEFIEFNDFATLIREDLFAK